MELAAMAAPDQFVDLFHKELLSVKHTDMLLAQIEKHLMSEEVIDLNTADPEYLLKIYGIISTRRKSSQDFVARVLELAVRAKFSDKLLGMLSGREIDDGLPAATHPVIKNVKDMIRERVKANQPLRPEPVHS